jgi:ABC-type multidrug transport system ATPase subunit
MNSIEINNITKTYEKGTVTAIENLTLSIKKGELFGLIGPDGAGKTSLFRVLTTLLLPEKGSATVEGFDVVKDFWEIRKIVGYMPGKFSLYQDLTIQENINFFATVFNTTFEQNYEFVKEIYVQIEPFKNRRAGKLSGGMKQKLALCCALIHEPKVLFLDEPTTGVDPVSRKEFWDMLNRLKEKGITIMVSTPYMDEANRCDRIALIQHGKILDIDTLENILKKNKEVIWSIKSRDRNQLVKSLRKWDQTHSCFAFGDAYHLVLKDQETKNKTINDFLSKSNISDFEINEISPDIEDVFIKLMLENEK